MGKRWRQKEKGGKAKPPQKAKIKNKRRKASLKNTRWEKNSRERQFRGVARRAGGAKSQVTGAQKQGSGAIEIKGTSNGVCASLKGAAEGRIEEMGAKSWKNEGVAQEHEQGLDQRRTPHKVIGQVEMEKGSKEVDDGAGGDQTQEERLTEHRKGGKRAKTRGDSRKYKKEVSTGLGGKRWGGKSEDQEKNAKNKKVRAENTGKGCQSGEDAKKKSNKQKVDDATGTPERELEIGKNWKTGNRGRRQIKRSKNSKGRPEE